MEKNGLGDAKWGSSTLVVPPTVVSGIAPPQDGGDPAPDVGDVVVAEVESIGAHGSLEGCEGRRHALYPGDRIVGVMGHRYAPDQFEGYAETDGAALHLLSVAGVLGLVRSRNASMKAPTQLRWIGHLLDPNGERLNTRRFGIYPSALDPERRPSVVAVAGTMMNAGKTTTATAIVRGAAVRGLTVGAAKVTGTASGKDVASMRDAGAKPALDFTMCGWPSTYLCTAGELERTYIALYNALLRADPDLIVLELSDGIIQRETAMLLCSPTFTARLDAVVLAAGDALGAEAAAGRLRALGLPLVAVSGRASMSPLLVSETEAATGLRCLTKRHLEAGGLLDLIREPVLAA